VNLVKVRGMGRALRLIGWVVTAITSVVGVDSLAQAQSNASPCQPPQKGEYILLVLSQTQQSQAQVQRALPANTQATVCKYFEDTVTRIAGFSQLEDASSWARYVKDIVGLRAVVVRPTQAQATAANSSSYNPLPLGNGYAVLVDYFNQPEIASQIRQLIGGDVGLVSYGQRPYLLAVYTTSEGAANLTLQRLSDRGFWAMVVDSRRVTLLKQTVGN
jgi:hypothetical protein